MREAWTIVKQTFQAFFRDGATQLAAAVAFYAVLSLAPIAILALNLAQRVYGGEGAQVRVADEAEWLLGPEGGRVVSTIVSGEKARMPHGAVTVLSLASLLFAATAAFSQVQAALNAIWNVHHVPRRAVWNFVRKRLLSLAMLMILAILALLSVLLTSLINYTIAQIPGGLPRADLVWRAMNILSSLVLFTLLFAMVFKILPDAKIQWADVWVGAVVTAVLFAAGKEAIGLYLGRTAAGSPYGAAGSLILLLLWLYYSSLILFLGAEFTEIHMQRRGRPIVPVEHAERGGRSG